MSKFVLHNNQYIPYKATRSTSSGMPMCSTYYYITNEAGKKINKYTLKPYRGKQMEMFAFHDKLSAEQFVDNLNKSN